MTETTEMSPLEAARVLAQARDYEADLRTRTGGITWMLWGLVSCGIFLSYAFVSVLGAGGFWMNFLWVPWVLAGILAMNALWRSAALSMPAIRTMRWKHFWIRFAAISAAYFVLLWFMPITGPAQALVFMGLSWLAMGVLGFLRSTTPAGPRWVCSTVGLLTAGIGGLLILLHPGIEVEGTLSIVASGAIPFVAGLYQTYRG